MCVSVCEREREREREREMMPEVECDGRPISTQSERSDTRYEWRGQKSARVERMPRWHTEKL